MPVLEDWVDALGSRHRRFDGTPRIVSLVPSITEALVALGLIGALVGRTGFCVHPRAALHAVPKLGGTKDVRLERLFALEPTHVIVNIDENRRETVEEIARRVPHVLVTHPCAPEDNHALLQLLGGVFNRPGEAAALCGELAEALEEAAAVARELPAERVLYLIWRDPWMGISAATYIAATLSRVGWLSWPEETPARYPVLDPPAAADAGVARILLPSEPYRFRGTHQTELQALTGLPALLIDGTMSSWYGSRAPVGLRHLAALRRSLAAR